MTRKSLPITEDREANRFVAESKAPAAAAAFLDLLFAKPLPASLRAKFAALDVPEEVLEAGTPTAGARKESA